MKWVVEAISTTFYKNGVINGIKCFVEFIKEDTTSLLADKLFEMI